MDRRTLELHFFGWILSKVSRHPSKSESKLAVCSHDTSSVAAGPFHALHM
jgi:hypothetical protein